MRDIVLKFVTMAGTNRVCYFFAIEYTRYLKKKKTYKKFNPRYILYIFSIAMAGTTLLRNQLSIDRMLRRAGILVRNKPL